MITASCQTGPGKYSFFSPCTCLLQDIQVGFYHSVQVKVFGMLPAEETRILQRLYTIGGVPLLDRVMQKIRRPLGKELSSHLEYCWAETGDWLK